jgi:hypothetical protein
MIRTFVAAVTVIGSSIQVRFSRSAPITDPDDPPVIRKTMTAVGVGALCAVLAACGSHSDGQATTPGLVPGTYSAPTVSTSASATVTPSSLVCPGATLDADGKMVCPGETKPVNPSDGTATFGTATVTLTSKQGYKARIDVKVSAPVKVTDLASIGDSANLCNNVIGETNSHSVGYMVHVETVTTDITGGGFAWEGSVPVAQPASGGIAYDPHHSAVDQPIRARVLCTEEPPRAATFGPKNWTLAVWDTATPTHKVNEAAVRKAALWLTQISISGAGCSPDLQGGGSNKFTVSPKARWDDVKNACRLNLLGVEPNRS